MYVKALEQVVLIAAVLESLTSVIDVCRTTIAAPPYKDQYTRVHVLLPPILDTESHNPAL